MNRVTRGIILFALGAATVTVLALNIPTFQVINSDIWLLSGIYLLMTAIAVSMGVLINKGELSAAHAVGMVAFLSLSRTITPLMVWATFIGGLMGAVFLYLRRNPYLPSSELRNRIATGMILASSRVTLSFYMSAQIYKGLNGQLPLMAGTNAAIPPLIMYSFAYLVSYFSIYLLEIYLDEQDVLETIHDRWLQILFILIVPVAYAILGAIVYTQLPIELFGFVVIGLLLIVVVPYGYTRTQQMLRDQLDEMQALSQISQDLQTQTDLHGLLDTIERDLSSIIDADGFTVAILHRDGEQMNYPLMVYNKERQEERYPDPADTLLIKILMEDEDTLLISHDVAAYMQFQSMSPHQLPVTSWLGAAMKTSQRRVGALILYNTTSRFFEPAQTEMLQIIASTLGAAIVNVQHYQQQQEHVRKLNVLNTISVLLSSTLSTENVLDTIASSAAMLAESKAIAVYLAESEQDDSELVRSAGLSARFLEAPPRLLMAREPLPTRRLQTTTLYEYPPIIVRDVNTNARTRHLRDIFADENIHAFIELPMVSGNEPMGAIIVYYDEPQFFDAEFIEFLRTFANEAMQAIKNARQYTTTDRALAQRLKQLSILAAVGHQTNASVDLESISEILLDKALDYTQVQRGGVAVYIRGETQLKLLAHLGYDEPTQHDTTQIEQQAQHLKHQITKQASASAAAQTFKLADYHSRYMVPILRDQDLLGVLILEPDDPAGFDDDTLDFLSQLVNQAAIAIDNRMLLQRVSQARDRLQVIVDAMKEGIVLLDNQGEVVLANPAVDLIGLSHTALMGHTVDNLLADNASDIDISSQMGFESPVAFQRLLRQLGAAQWTALPPTPYTVQGEHGSLYIERQVIPIYDEIRHLIGALLIFYDQTEAQELNRTRDDFTRMIVHDLRSPLTAVVASMSLINHLIPKESEVHPKVERITDTSRQAIKKLMQRIDALLDVAKMESGEISLEREPVELRTIVGNVFGELVPIADEQGINLINDVHDIWLMVDIDKTERVMQNLIDNALKYAPSGTSITVRSERADDDAFVRIAVVDQGPGIPHEYKDHLFDRFVQIRGQRGARRGVGLGLTFCRLVVDAHKGRIWVEDNPEGGSIFAMMLPVATLKTSVPHDDDPVTR